MDNMRALVDSLNPMSPSGLERLKQSAAADTSADRNAGLKFSRGDRVIDLASGARGVVENARRDDVDRLEHCRVKFDDGRQVIRLAAELEADKPAAPAPSSR